MDLFHDRKNPIDNNDSDGFFNGYCNCNIFTKTLGSSGYFWKLLLIQYCDDSRFNDKSICKSIRCGIVNGKDYGQCPSAEDKCLETRCGKGIGQCPSGQCCREKGYCDTTKSICYASLECKTKYGKCDSVN
ncbi:carbohydrate-binding module family 18 protein [Piromyces sp. E2]|nr:carbohydrate-binding module family 18 protein [Piromyces sp. E2]|eukprot:OUM66718.1 carbohydrate-binding module family 18 protein [Piromyces sp. E2]